jgi:hypothetical protein
MGWEAKLWGERCRPCIEGSREKVRKWLRVNSACGRRIYQQSGKGGKGGNKMILSCPDRSLRGVGAVVGGRDALEIYAGRGLMEKLESSSLVSLSRMR